MPTASFGCRSNGGCTPPTVTAQRSCCVNTDSPGSGTAGNDTAVEKPDAQQKAHTHTRMKVAGEPGASVVNKSNISLRISSRFYLYLSSLTPSFCTVFSLIQPKLGHGAKPSTHYSTGAHVCALAWTHTHTRSGSMLIISTNRTGMALRVGVTEGQCAFN